MPYLPGLLKVTDFEYLFAALAPRPLIVVRWGNPSQWPTAGYDRIEAMAGQAFRLTGSAPALSVIKPAELTAATPAQTQDELRRQMLAAARAMLPAPPQSGQAGAADALMSRQTVDSSAGLVWVLSEVSGKRQEFAGEGTRLAAWSFFNDNGQAEKGRALTPLIFRKSGKDYLLTGVGMTRTNDGSGLQPHDFVVVAGNDAIGQGFYFGCYGGTGAGQPNAGVIEFDDGTEDLIDILTLDGQIPNQSIRLGESYQVKVRLPRTYSLHATSKRP